LRSSLCVDSSRRRPHWCSAGEADLASLTARTIGFRCNDHIAGADAKMLVTQEAVMGMG